jgi:hypothetical protein
MSPICAPARCGRVHQWYDPIILLVRFVWGHYGDSPQDYYGDGQAR